MKYSNIYIFSIILISFLFSFSFSQPYFAIITKTTKIQTLKSKRELPEGLVVIVNPIENKITLINESITGEIINGEYEILIPSFHNYLVTKDTYVYMDPSLESGTEIEFIPQDKIIDSEYIFFTRNRMKAFLSELNGWISTKNLIDLKTKEKYFLFKDKLIKVFLYNPVEKKYYFENKWIDENQLIEVNIKKINKYAVILDSSSVYKLPLNKKEIKILKSGEITKIFSKLSINNEEWFKTKYGYIKNKKFKFISKLDSSSIWILKNANILKIPNGKVFIKLDKPIKVKPLFILNNYIYFQYKYIKGWVLTKSISLKEPKEEKEKNIKREFIFSKNNKPKHIKTRKKAVVTIALLNLRKEPNIQSKIIAVIPKGYKVILLDKNEGKWVYVMYYSKTKKQLLFGWMSKNYLKVNR